MILRTIVRIGAAFMIANCSAAAADFENGFPHQPDFFPIGVWLQSSFRAPKYKAIEINTYVALWEGPTEARFYRTSPEPACLLLQAQEISVGLRLKNRQVDEGLDARGRTGQRAAHRRGLVRRLHPGGRRGSTVARD